MINTTCIIHTLQFDFGVLLLLQVCLGRLPVLEDDNARLEGLLGTEHPKLDLAPFEKLPRETQGYCETAGDDKQIEP